MNLNDKKVRLIQLMILADTQKDKKGLLEAIEQVFTVEDERDVDEMIYQVEKLLMRQMLTEESLKGVENATEQ